MRSPSLHRARGVALLVAALSARGVEAQALLVTALLSGCGPTPAEPVSDSPGAALEDLPGASAAAAQQARPRVARADEQAVDDPSECVARLTRELPDAVARLFADLGYVHALEDACEAQRAEHEGDEAGCDALRASALRAGCRRRLAVRHARPDACPQLRDLGREPVCLAWAARAPARCVAAVGTQQLLCRAPFEDNPALCRELGVERAPCEAAVAEIGPQLQPRDGRALPHIEGALVARFIADAPRRGTSASLDQPVELDLSHGVYVSRTGCAATLQLAPERRTLAHREHVQLVPFALQLGELRDEPLGDVEVEAARLHVGLLPMVGGPASSLGAVARPGARAVVAGSARLGGVVRVLSLRPRRGGEVSLEVGLEVPAQGGRYHVSGRLRTFVRDIDPLGECQGAQGLL